MPDRRRAEVMVDIKVGKIDLQGGDISGKIAPDSKDTDAFVDKLKDLRMFLPNLVKLIKQVGVALKYVVNPYVLAGLALLGSAFVAVGLPLAKLIILARLAGVALRWAFGVGLQAVQRLAAGIQDFAERGFDAIRDFTKEGISVFADFEQQAANTTTVLGVFGDAAEAMRDRVMDVARDISVASRKTATEIIESAYHIASAGFTAAQTFAAMKPAVVLAEATLSDLEKTAEMVVSTINQFRLPAERFIDIANIMAAAISKSPATLDKLRSSLEYVGATAGQFGHTLEGTVAALMALYKTGRVGARAGTELRNVYNALAKQTDEARKALDAVGLSIDELSPATHTIGQIVAKFEELRDRIGQANFAMLVNKAFTMRAASGILALTTIGSREMERMEKAITGTNLAFQMQADQLKSFEGVWDRLKSDLVEIKIEFSKGLVQKALFPALLAVHKLYEKLRDLGVFKRIGEFIADAAMPLKAFTDAVVKLVLGYAPAFVKFFERAGGVAKSVFARGLVIVYNALKEGIPWLLKFGNQMVDLIEKVNKPEVWGVLNKVVGRFGEIIKAVADEIVGRLKVGLPKVTAYLAQFGDVMPQIVERTKLLLDQIGQFVDFLWANLPKALRMAADAMDSLVTGMQQAITFARILSGLVPGVALLALVMNDLAAGILMVGRALDIVVGLELMTSDEFMGLMATLGQTQADLWDLMKASGGFALHGVDMSGFKADAMSAAEAIRGAAGDIERLQGGRGPGAPEFDLRGLKKSGLDASGVRGPMALAPAVAAAAAGRGGMVVGPFYIDGSEQAGRIAKQIVDRYVKREEFDTRVRAV